MNIKRSGSQPSAKGPSDWFTGAAQSELSVLRRTVRVLPDNEPRDHLVSLPVCRLKRSATGAFELDSRFVAPAVSIAAVPALDSASV